MLTLRDALRWIFQDDRRADLVLGLLVAALAALASVATFALAELVF